MPLISRSEYVGRSRQIRHSLAKHARFLTRYFLIHEFQVELGVFNLLNALLSSAFTVLLFIKLEYIPALPNLCIFVPLWSLLLLNIVVYSSKQYKERLKLLYRDY